MTMTRQSHRKQNDRGAITVETAAALIPFFLVLALAIGGVTASINQVQCIDAAWAAARLTARGDPEQARDAARRIAPKGAEITIREEGEHIHVAIRASPPGGTLLGVRLHAEAFAVREPGG
jgi:hypothetical protein